MAKFTYLFVILGILTGCQGLFEYGFYMNPVRVALIAQSSIESLDVTTMQSITAKSAKCLYANTKGLKYLQKNLASYSDLSVDMGLEKDIILSQPRYNGMRIYKTSLYKISVVGDGAQVLDGQVACHFGERQSNVQTNGSYSQAYCELTKISPIAFGALTQQGCESL